jgi:hypothetical protein
MRRIVSILGAALSMLTAAVAARPVPDYSNVHTVAIASALGDVMVLKQHPDLFGTPEPDRWFDTGLHVDDYAVQQIARSVGARFTVVDGGIDPALLAQYGLPPALLASLRAKAAQKPLPDALILVHAKPYKVQGDQPQFTLSFSYSGLTLVRTDGTFNYSTQLSDHYLVTVIDARGGTVLGEGVAVLPPTGMFNAQPLPMLDCRKFWPTAPVPTPLEAEQLRADVMGTMAMTLPNALRNAGLTSLGMMDWITDWNGITMRCGKFG